MANFYVYHYTTDGSVGRSVASRPGVRRNNGMDAKLLNGAAARQTQFNTLPHKLPRDSTQARAIKCAFGS